MRFNNLDRNQEESQRQFLGKKVSLVVKGQEWVGDLVFSGKNEMLNQLQVTLDGTPLKVTKEEMQTLKLV